MSPKRVCYRFKLDLLKFSVFLNFNYGFWRIVLDIFECLHVSVDILTRFAKTRHMSLVPFVINTLALLQIRISLRLILAEKPVQITFQTFLVKF